MCRDIRVFLIIRVMDVSTFKKNVPNWHATDDDYRLVFRKVNGQWVEISDNLAKYAGKTFADYLYFMDICIPEGCTFCRIKRDGRVWEFRDNGSYIRVDYKRGE